jgi:hypothetical protein
MGKILKLNGETAFGSNHVFRQSCLDILMPEVPREEREEVRRVINDALAVYFRQEARYG